MRTCGQTEIPYTVVLEDREEAVLVLVRHRGVEAGWIFYTTAVL
jgi:hypothetical protein